MCKKEKVFSAFLFRIHTKKIYDFHQKNNHIEILLASAAS